MATISTSLPSKRISTPAAALLSSPTSTNPAKTKVVGILKEWESLSQLSLQEEQILEQLQQQHSSRPFYINKQNTHPLHLTTPSTPRTPSATSTSISSLSYRHELASFYQDLYRKEFSAENEDEQEQFISSQMNQLNTYKRICDDMIGKVNTTLSLCEELKEQYTNVSNKTITLHKDCEKLVQEKEQLSKICNGIESRLNFFNEFEQFTSALNAGAINMHSADFSSNLKLLDESIQFLLRNPNYKEARVYLTKYKQLFARAQGHLRDYIVNSLSKATKSMQVKTPETPSSYAQELSSLYIQYRTSIENLKPLIREIELRSYIKEYSVYLSDCFDCYLEQRRLLMYPLIEKRIQSFASENNITNFVRQGSQYMLSVCSEEEQLFKHLFSNETLMPRLRMLIETFCSLLYEGLRAMVLSQNNIDVLCDLIAILQNEFLKTKAKNLKAFETVVHRMIQDIQERLIFRASSYISDNLRSFKPKPEDLNYPAKLLEKQKAATTTEVQSTEASNPSNNKFDGYYPTLELTLTFLSKLYQSLDVEVFESFAHTAVSLCTNSFIEASKKISEKKGIVDGELFLIKHLLTFREQLSAFNVSFASTETSLDFSSLSQGFSKFLKGQTTLSVSGIIFDIMSQSRPKIVHKHVDSKKDLEKLIFITVRESFILNVTRIIFDPIIAFLKKVSSQPKASGENQAASSEEALQLYQSCLQNMEQVLATDLKPKLSLYLPNPATREELYKGIRQSLTNVYQEFYSLAQEMGPEVQKQILSPQAFVSKLE